jgi:5-methylcytosine-specific restriction endonuclease McrA
MWFQAELDLFARSMRLAADGDILQARDLLAGVRSDELRSWYLVHGQNSGGFRTRHFRLPSPAMIGGRHGQPSRSMIACMLERDHYRCRYCGLRLFPIEVLQDFSTAMGTDCFSCTAKNLSHGAALVFRPTYDHVIPLSSGGGHTLENLVAACYSCNFGKRNYTLEQLGLDDPRSRPARDEDGWDGLTSIRSRFRRHF